MIVADQNPRLGTRGSKTEPVYNVIKAALKQREQVLARNASHAVGLFKVPAELLLKNTVYTANFLLFTKLDPVVGNLRSPLPMLTGGVITALDGTLVSVATLTLQKQFCILPPAEPAGRTCISSQR
jgi:hypothetical protein